MYIYSYVITSHNETINNLLRKIMRCFLNVNCFYENLIRFFCVRRYQLCGFLWNCFLRSSKSYESKRACGKPQTKNKTIVGVWEMKFCLDSMCKIEWMQIKKIIQSCKKLSRLITILKELKIETIYIVYIITLNFSRLLVFEKKNYYFAFHQSSTINKTDSYRAATTKNQIKDVKKF